MKKLTLGITFVLALSLLLSACGGDATSAGKDLFAQPVIGASAGCITCHSLDAGTVLVGPSMAGIGTRAASAVAGLSAEDYLKQSITEPNAHLVEGFDPDVMPATWTSELSTEQIDQLIAYLLTLK